MSNPRVAIIGAGVAGLAAAWRLRETPIEVTVFDKSRGLSGRAASRTRHGARFDIGANYFKLDDPELEHLVLQQLSQQGLARIEGEVWTFDQSGRIAAGDAQQNQQAKWTYSSGISTLGKHLAAAAEVEVRFETRISALLRQTGSWHLSAEHRDIEHSERFAAVLMTPPAPQAREILAASALDGVDHGAIDTALAGAQYHPQWCFALGFPQPLQPRPACFALINSDRAHDIAWLSFENDKPARELGDSTVLMVQMSPHWSAQHGDATAEQLLPQVRQAALALLGLPDRAVAWFDAQRWRFAHPHQAADAQGLALAEPAGLFFAGDALVGKGRVGAAMATGLRAADRIIARLG